MGGSASVPPRGASGSASVGSASVGSASVGRAGPGRASVPVSPAPGGPAAGRAGAGRASVPVSPAPGSGPAGRASVGAGRASVGAAVVGGPAGRASVGRAGMASVPGGGAGGPGGPGGPTGPGRGGRRGAGDPDAVARAKKRRRVNLMIASLAVFIMLAGIGVVGFTYYSTTVVLPEQVPMPLSTTVYAKDNKTVLAKLGTQNRQLVKIDDIPQWVQDAVAAAEDRNFYRHSGVDYKGIARAAWNNFTGGDKQGASTITQQYARNAYDNLKDDTYARKVKEAILASKLNDKYSKPEIMEHYLNVIYFGRGAYGIEAAAQTYFGVPTKKLTVAQAAVLAALIKQPVASETHKGYDPAVNPTDAKARWTYVLDGMVAEGWLNAPNRPQRPTDDQYPKTLSPKDAGSAAFGVKTPRGNVINYVREEMEQMGICTNSGAAGKISCVDALRDGGYRIQTTIDPKLQTAAENTAMRAKKNSELADQPKNLMAAVVSIDPKNGRVLAYYGGDSGADFDYAGKNTDASGNITGGHPPGSSFKVYTLAAAINAGISVKSHWDATPFKPKGFKNPVQNAGRDVSKTCGKWCTLESSTIQSYNVPFFHVSEKIGPDKVVDMARQAGITTMWTTSDNPPKAVDLTKKKGADVAPAPFYHVIGYGQYPVTVLDHANGLATLANDGKYNKAHFVLKVEQQDQDTGKWKVIDGEKLSPQQRIRKDVANEVTGVLKQIAAPNGRSLENGREVAAKTGTWEKYDSRHNAHAWMVGYTPQLATAVWVGSRDPKKPEIIDKNGNDIGGSKLPGAIWQRYMNAALDGKDKESLPSVTGVGDQDAGNGTQPPPPPPTPGRNCGPLDIFGCPQNPNNPGGNQGGNQGGPGGGTGGPDNPPGPRDGGQGGGLLPTTAPRARD
ncbi:membrane peptidoglycan carboxypeptidase [Micromonospora olivasterospora]|uniref:Membrane peptidoglycan carboxypeptidase n=1 Tax=Micromonospora olivasterospora TaxID=1880 RepID=A0A562I9J3_MICOL|nr:membrane peptidoglycan carboxypeptidase [Micromonospora olivasterospora]